MTIICGYRPAGSRAIWLAADSRVCGGDFIYPTTARKIARCGEWLVGAAGSARFHEWLACDSAWSSAVQFRDEIFAYAKGAGVESEADKGEPVQYGFQFILARSGELFVVASNGAIITPAWGFAAVGSGQPYAYGAAHALLSDPRGMRDIAPERFLARVVSTVVQLQADCGGELQIESVGG